MLNNLVEDLRLLTLAETRQLSLDCREVNLGEIAEYTASLFEAEAADKDIALTVQVAPNLPSVMADPQRIGQVIGNLLSNALRYAPARGEVTMTVQQIKAGVALTIADNGPGVSETDLSRLFDRFWRGEKSRTRSAGGVGRSASIGHPVDESYCG